MSNAAGAKTTREEEIAFLAMEQVLGVDIKLADAGAGAGDKMPDGSWVCPDGQERHGIVEVTSPPAASLMVRWARAKKAGLPQTESGSIPLRLNELAQVCDEMLAADWARGNIDKLVLRCTKGIRMRSDWIPVIRSRGPRSGIQPDRLWR